MVTHVRQVSDRPPASVVVLKNGEPICTTKTFIEARPRVWRFEIDVGFEFSVDDILQERYSIAAIDRLGGQCALKVSGAMQLTYIRSVSSYAGGNVGKAGVNVGKAGENVGNAITSLDIMVTALGRPELLCQLAQSLARQVGVEHLRLRVYLFQDSPIVEVGPPIADPELCRRSAEVFLAELPHAKLVAAKTNLGIVGNCERIFEHVKTSDADAFVFFEEDLVLSEHYLATIVQLLTQAAENPLIGLVGGVPVQVRDLSAQRQRASAVVRMGLFKWGIGFSRRTYERMAGFLDAYFAICRHAYYRCNGRDRPEFYEPARRFFYELGYPGPVGSAGPDVAFDVFSFLYIMDNVCTWVCLAKYTGRIGLHFGPKNYDEMNLGAVEIYDGQITSFDIPTVAESLATVQAWRVSMLEQRVTEKASETVNKLRLAAFDIPYERRLSEARRHRIKTHWGTVVFADTERGMLRHGNDDLCPANLFAAEDNETAYLVHVAPDGTQHGITVASFENLPDRSYLGQSTEPGEAFAITPIQGDGDPKFGLRSAGRFLCAEIDGRVTLSRSALGPWEAFQFILEPAVG